MTEIKLHVVGASASATWTGRLTSNAVGIQVQYTFDASWTGLAITGYAKCGKVERKVVLDGQGRGKVPRECLIAGNMLRLGAKGVAIDGSVVIPTIWAATEIVSPGTGDSTAGSADPDPTPEQVDLITAVAQAADRKAASAEEKAQSVVDRANAREFNGADGVSPTVTVTDIEGGHRVTITDAEGSKSFDVKDGGGSGGGAVDSVNGKTGVVVLNANDVGALPADTPLFDGNYESLSNKPMIPDAYDDTAVQQMIGQKYEKPSTGIPASDIADGVIPTVPQKLPNPNALTFTGAATGSYDGSQPLSIEIPSGGGGTKYKLLGSVTLTEPVRMVGINVNVNDVNEIVVVGKIKEAVKTGYQYAYVAVNNKSVTYNTSISDAQERFLMYHGYMLEGGKFLQEVMKINASGTGPLNSPISIPQSGFDGFGDAISTISIIHANTDGLLAEGSYFEFWGR